MVDETEMLRICQSLERLSVELNGTHFAHCALVECSTYLEDSGAVEVASFHMNWKDIQTKASKVCLMYIILRDFNQVVKGSLQKWLYRLVEYSCSNHAVNM